MLDDLVIGFDRALRTLSRARDLVAADARRQHRRCATLAPEERRHAAGPDARQSHRRRSVRRRSTPRRRSTARDPAIRQQFAQAAREEEEHLAWTRQRLAELSRSTVVAESALVRRRLRDRHGSPASASDRVNLGFVVETERQVEDHLTGHIEQLPPADARSRAIVEQMRDDEARHGAMAQAAGAVGAAVPGQATLMRAAADVMRAVAYRI